MAIDLDYCGGPHFTIEASGIKPDKLEDQAFISGLFSTLADKMNCRDGGLQTVFAYAEDQAERGLCASAVINGCHLTIHTFAGQDRLQISLYSPAEIDTQLIQREVLAAFDPKEHELCFISPGASSCVS